MSQLLALVSFLVPLLPAEPSQPPSVPTAADSAARQIRYEFTVAASPGAVWGAWTTPAGLRSFFAPAAVIELETFGRFDIHFDPNAPPGKRGAEGNVVLGVDPERMLTATWDAPPEYPAVRAQRTFLEIRLAPEGTSGTRVVITQSGFGTGGEWDEVYRYFEGAWTWVAAALQYRFEVGPIDWTRPPDLLPRMKALGGAVAERWASRKQ